MGTTEVRCKWCGYDGSGIAHANGYGGISGQDGGYRSKIATVPIGRYVPSGERQVDYGGPLYSPLLAVLRLTVPYSLPAVSISVPGLANG